MVSFLSAQGKKDIAVSVSYVAASTVYLNGGRDNNIAVGDTAHVYRGISKVGTVIVTAVSKKSAASKIDTQFTPIVVGDIAKIAKEVGEDISAQTAVKPTAADTSTVPAAMSAGRINRASDGENVISGRVGIQYSGVYAEDTRLNINQPATILRLSVQNLFGSGLVFSMYDRSYYDVTNVYRRYSNDPRLKNRMFEFSLQTSNSDLPYGFGIGRMTSTYVGGVGTFDGAHFYYRVGNMTAGILLGSKIDDQTYGVNAADKKGAFFVNARFGSDFLHEYSGTIAYGRQLADGKLDREFMYLQNSWMMGSQFSLYETSEIELNDISNGMRSRTFKLSNTYLSLNYYPAEWLSTSLGYDGSRPVYLFETMKSFSDTLLDKNFLQGYRGSVTLRLSHLISMGADLTYRSRKGDARDARNLSGTFRMSDIAGTDIGAGLRYTDIAGVYSNGKNFTADLDRTFFYNLSLSLRYDYYKYTILTQKQTYITQTGTFSSSYLISRMVYTSLSVDGVLDATMNSLRVYAEIGIRF